ncbi:hypothetical protein V4762_01080 [Thermodesulfobium sp. 4217-1]
MTDEIDFGFFNLGAFLFCGSNLRLYDIVGLDFTPKKFLEVRV